MGGETYMVVQWLRFYAPSAEGLGSIPGQGTRPHMLQPKKEKKNKDTSCCNEDQTYLILICLTVTKTQCSQIN